MTHNTGDSYASVCESGGSIMKDLQAGDLHDADKKTPNAERPTPNVEANAQRGEIGASRMGMIPNRALDIGRSTLLHYHTFEGVIWE